MHSDNAFTKPSDDPSKDDEEMTTDEVKAEVAAWVAARES